MVRCVRLVFEFQRQIVNFGRRIVHIPKPKGGAKRAFDIPLSREMWHRGSTPTNPAPPMNLNASEVDAKLRQLMPEISGPMAGAIRFILANREEIPVRSMRELAQRANVPPVTLVRLAQRLGFEGFDEFREVYVEALIGGQSVNRG